MIYHRQLAAPSIPTRQREADVKSVLLFSSPAPHSPAALLTTETDVVSGAVGAAMHRYISPCSSRSALHRIVAFDERLTTNSHINATYLSELSSHFDYLCNGTERAYRTWSSARRSVVCERQTMPTHRARLCAETAFFVSTPRRVRILDIQSSWTPGRRRVLRRNVHEQAQGLAE